MARRKVISRVDSIRNHGPPRGYSPALAPVVRSARALFTDCGARHVSTRGVLCPGASTALLDRRNSQVDRIFRRSELGRLWFARSRGQLSRVDGVELGVCGLRGRDEFGVGAVGHVDPADVVVLAIAPARHGLVYPLVPVGADDRGVFRGVLYIV